MTESPPKGPRPDAITLDILTKIGEGVTFILEHVPSTELGTVYLVSECFRNVAVRLDTPFLTNGIYSDKGSLGTCIFNLEKSFIIENGRATRIFEYSSQAILHFHTIMKQH